MTSYRKTTLELLEIKEPLLSQAPLLIDDWTLAFRLGATGKMLWYIAKYRHMLYAEFSIPKKNGELRRVFNPNHILRMFHQQLRTQLLAPLCASLGPHVAAYQVGRSTLDAARVHLRDCPVCDATTQSGTRTIRHTCPRAGTKFKLDLKDFFLSTTRAQIRRYFHETVGYNHYVSSLLGQLLTTTYFDFQSRLLHDGVPPGALIAGDICNLVCDATLDKYVFAALTTLGDGWRYTRYADDLYFSHSEKLSAKQITTAVQSVAACITRAGYRPNWKKYRVQRCDAAQHMLGLTINRKLNIPAYEYRRMHMLLYKAYTHGFIAQLSYARKADLTALHNWINGKLNYFHTINPAKAAKLQRLYTQALGKQEVP